jgi:addiction module HigA family antidote
MTQVPEPAPISPGEVLRDEILALPGVTQETLAAAMSVSRFTINQIVNERRSVTAEMALRLSKALSTTPEFWLNLQMAVDLYRARMKLRTEVEDIRIVRVRPDTAAFSTVEELLSRSTTDH